MVRTLRLAGQLGLLGSIGLICLAMFLGNQTEALPAPSWRVLESAPVRVVSQYVAPSEGAGATLFNSATGAFSQLILPAGEMLDHARLSPWRDQDGNWQIVGSWTRWRGRAGESRLVQAGILRMTYPEGRVLDRIETSEVPIGPPCWMPGSKARVVYSSINGNLYSLDFEPAVPLGRDGLQPRIITWSSRPESLKLVQLNDPYWPTDPRFGGKLLVSLSFRDPRMKDRMQLTSQIWWLELDSGECEVTGAGPVTLQPPSERRVDELSPVVWAGSSGELLLASLSQDPDTRTWQVHVAPILFRDGVPRSMAVKGRPVPSTYRPEYPIFNPAGSEVICLLSQGKGRPTPTRVAIDDLPRFPSRRFIASDRPWGRDWSTPRGSEREG